MDREEVKAIIIESYNALSFADTAVLLKAVEEGCFTGAKMTVEEFIEYSVDCYEGVCDTADQLRKQLKYDNRVLIADFKD